MYLFSALKYRESVFLSRIWQQIGQQERDPENERQDPCSRSSANVDPKVLPKELGSNSGQHCRKEKSTEAPNLPRLLGCEIVPLAMNRDDVATDAKNKQAESTDEHHVQHCYLVARKYGGEPEPHR